eukprot:14291-Heterococcus_DN1.PRE.1
MTLTLTHRDVAFNVALTIVRVTKSEYCCVSASSDRIGALSSQADRLIDCFGASEVTRQTVTGSLRAPPLVKDIETTTLYTQVADGQLDAVQITCTYLVPPRQPQAVVSTDSSDAAAASTSSSSSSSSAGVTTDDTVLSPALIWAANERSKWEQAGMKAIDRRVYSVTYKR